MKLGVMKTNDELIGEQLRTDPEFRAEWSEIAARSGRSRESIRLLIAGERGRGDFPPPVSHLRDRNRLWLWSDVADWLGQSQSEQFQDALFVAALNAALELRRRKSQLPDQERELIAELVS